MNRFTIGDCAKAMVVGMASVALMLLIKSDLSLASCFIVGFIASWVFRILSDR